MTLTIKNVRLATDYEWDSIWEGCDYATYFQSREWTVIWTRYTGGKVTPVAKLIIFSDAKEVLLPFSCEHILKGSIKQYLSSPAGTFGGWLSLDELNETHLRLLCKYIISHYRNILWRLNPFDPLAKLVDVSKFRYEETHVLDLEPGFDYILRNWSKGNASIARKARKAEKLGIRVGEACSVDDWKGYYQVYEDSLDRWGKSASSAYDWLIFRTMFELGSSRLKLWLATYQEQIIAGAVCFYAKKHVVYWHGAALASYFDMRPVNFLMFEIVRDASERGFQWFDFNPSGGHEGVERFKSSFGTTKIPCPILEKKTVVLNVITWLSTMKRNMHK